MWCLKLVAVLLRDIIGSCKRNVKFRILKALWRIRNPHNRTIANMIFPHDIVSVGSETYGHLNVHSYGHRDEKLCVGNCCSIAGNVHFILSGAHDYKRFTTFPFEAYYSPEGVDQAAKGPIIVEDDVWIGYGVTILSGVRIGKGAVIAAGSIVCKDVPPYAIWIGNKVAKYRFSEQICEQLKSLDFSMLNMEKVSNSTLLRKHISEDNWEELLAEIEACNGSD